MLARTAATAEQEPWQIELGRAYRAPLELLDALGLTAEQTGVSPAAAASFDFLVPRPFAARMRRHDPADPLLLQVLPAAAEMVPAPGFTRDPVGDLAAQVVPGLLHKYTGRVLLAVNGACAIHCRYCFRRHFPYADTTGARHWPAALAYIREHASISEVILSGGDPLLLKDGALGTLIGDIGRIPHVRRLRLHTRIPVALPARVTPNLLNCLTPGRLQTIVVVHANHAREIDHDVCGALGQLRAAGIPLLNQTVLLRGVNDRAALLAELSTRLFAAGVLPYYVHVLDPVAGAAHFAVPLERAVELATTLRAELPGYLVPAFVREVRGAPAKVPIA